MRAVGDPNDRMREDRLRALRAIRFAGRLGFSIDAATWAAIVASASDLQRLSAERVKQELEKTMAQLRRPSAALRLWVESGAMAVLVPALAQVERRVLDAVDCVRLLRAANAPRRQRQTIVRFATLFSGVGGGAASGALAALRFSKADAAAISTVVDRLRRSGPAIEHALTSDARVDDADVRRWVADIGRLNLAAVMRVALALWAARRAAGDHVPDDRVVRALYRRLFRSRFRDPIELADLAADGDDLRRAGIPPGPGLGKILQALLDRVIRDPSLNTPGWLVEEAKRLYGTATEGGGSPDTTRGR